MKLMGWLSGWLYRKSHIINSAAGAGTNYQVKVKVHYGSGSDSGEDVYLNSHCKTDFGDVRFTDDDGSTLLDYWMESKVDSDYAVFWVEVADDLSSQNQTIYVYYGKSDATTTSNGDNTFIFFDHFANLDKWTIYTGTGGSVSIVDGTYADIKGTTSSVFSVLIKTSLLGQSNVAIRFREKWLTSGYYLATGVTPDDPTSVNFGGNRHVYQARKPTSTDYHVMWDAGQYKFDKDLGYGHNVNTWFTMELKSKSGKQVLIDDTTVKDTQTITHSWTDVRIFFQQYTYTATNEYYVDWIFARKFVDPEPSHGGWGSEETETVLKEVADSLGLSDALLCGKTFVVADSVGLFDAPLRDWMPLSSDAVALSDSVLRSKQFSVSDSVGVGELVTVITEIVRHVTDGVAVSDVVGLDKALLLTDQIQLAENVYVDRVLVVSDGVVLVEVVEKAVAGAVKTKIFLLMGDVAIQLTGD
jgi:hypothetical protein